MTQIDPVEAQPDRGDAPRQFALIGAAGFVAPRHMKAVKDTGNVLAAAFDPNDSAGVMDSYFPDAGFFTEFERFDRHLDKLRRKKKKVDFVSICSPNYLHDAHIRFALRNEAHAICEKPSIIALRDRISLADGATHDVDYEDAHLRHSPTPQGAGWLSVWMTRPGNRWGSSNRWTRKSGCAD